MLQKEPIATDLKAVQAAGVKKIIDRWGGRS